MKKGNVWRRCETLVANVLFIKLIYLQCLVFTAPTELGILNLPLGGADVDCSQVESTT
jgi:hypothetical protein